MMVNLSDEEVKALDTMIRKLVYKKKGAGKIPFQMSVEDVVSEMWITAMEVINKKGSVEMNLIAIACLCRLVDLTRAYVRRPCVAIDPSRFSYLLGEEDSIEHKVDGSRAVGELLTSKLEQPGENLPLDDILNLFEKDSKEYKFVKLMIGASGARVESPEDAPDSCAVDGFVAMKMGYASVSSNGYKRVRSRVRETIREHYLSKED